MVSEGEEEVAGYLNYPVVDNLFLFTVFVLSYFPSLNQGFIYKYSCPPYAVSLAPSTPPITDFLTPRVPAALGAVVFGHVVGHPVHLGRPAFSQCLVKLLAKLFQGLIVRLPQSQRVLMGEEGKG